MCLERLMTFVRCLFHEISLQSLCDFARRFNRSIPYVSLYISRYLSSVDDRFNILLNPRTLPLNVLVAVQGRIFFV